MFRHLAISSAIAALPIAAMAAGQPDDNPPTPTETTTVCEDGQIWDAESKICKPAEDAALDDATRYNAVREFAYAGQYQNALRALDAMANQSDDRVLTYRGFATRKMGDVATGMAYYRAALVANPDNLLVRSYMGQAFVEAGDLQGAREQLTEIRARGGRESWPEWSLANALATGTTYSY